MIVYGRNPVREALRGPRQVTQVWASHGAAREPWLLEHEPRLSVVGPEELDRRAGTTAHQGLCADVSPFHYASGESLLGGERGVIVALDQVQDPQNLGAICRSAECAGALGVVITERRAAEVTPAVCKASAGAVEHLPVARVRNLTDFLEHAKRASWWCYGADGGAPQRYDAVDYGERVVLVLGAEGHGLRPRVAAACDALVSIPLLGRIESLSVGAAAAILLYAAANSSSGLDRERTAM
ncbi:MAG TPA: 23S rRNA (guanosine(2251)-2'-O)-methyltransferase RlmB [Solirubrobacteraceae bacterium]|nr:23S rRNA (guanosine(2251)-2'-O)-methyltransferase RlmB [Solirubrobacteraceae bacterium]